MTIRYKCPNIYGQIRSCVTSPVPMFIPRRESSLDKTFNLNYSSAEFFAGFFAELSRQEVSHWLERLPERICPLIDNMTNFIADIFIEKINGEITVPIKLQTSAKTSAKKPQQNIK